MAIDVPVKLTITGVVDEDDPFKQSPVVVSASDVRYLDEYLHPEFLKKLRSSKQMGRVNE